METAQTMNAIRSHHRGGSETLVYESVARPVPGSGEVLVEVHAAAITPTELTWDPTWTDEHPLLELALAPRLQHAHCGRVEVDLAARP